MKHYMLPRTPVLREIHPSSELLSPSPNPNTSQKQRSSRRHRGPKENSDPSSMPDSFTNLISGKPSPALTGKAASAGTTTKSPLPPRPPPSSSSATPNPLKRKLSLETLLADAGAPCPIATSDSGVKVVVRMRPLSKDEEEAEMIVQKLSESSLTINGQTFTFDSVADMDSSQDDIFQLVGAPLVENCLAGFNSSVFAYGQTGSGKTYTMWGPANALLDKDLMSDQQGLTPRVFERLFARLNEEQLKHADKQLKYQCRCSFLEIYNEQITDLLDPSQKNLQIREDVKSGVYVENLTEECVSDMKDVVHLLLKGLSNRRTGSTSINAESSRSHSVFTCVVESRCKSMADGLSSFKTSRINLVDLAGSERQKLTGAAGDRLREAGNINRSLSQLGNLINILADISQTGKQRHIPYRDSRLTFLLQESLGGNAKMAMICAISPAQRCKSETFSTLRFAQRAKAIKNKAVVNEVMQDDVNFLREVIRQLKDELLRMKAHGGQSDPSGAYSNGWNARRSLNLLKFSLNHPIRLQSMDDDGDEEMEIDEEAVEKLCIQAGLELSTPNRVGFIKSESQDVPVTEEEQISQAGQANASEDHGIQRQMSDASDVIMEEEISVIDEKDGSIIEKMDVSDCSRIHENAGSGYQVMRANNDLEIPCNEQSNVQNSTSPLTVPVNDASPSNLRIVPCEVSPTLESPAPSSSPREFSGGRKSLRTSSMLTASQQQVVTNTSATKFSKRSNSKSPTVADSKNNFSTTENLAASLHHGLEIIDSHKQNSPLRRSPYRFSFKPADLKAIVTVEKADAGVQTTPEDYEFHDENIYICSNCKSTTPLDDLESAENQNLQLVPIDGSAEKSKMILPKAVEKVLAGAIRREMALEEFNAHQTSEIMQLKRLVQQYKHERECNALIGQLREEKISRLESLMDGVLPTEDFIEEELFSLKKEHELLKEKYDNHPEVLSTKLELKNAQNELERYRNFFEMGEREILLEEIQDLRSQLQYNTDSARKASQRRSSMLQLTYPSEPNTSSPLNTISELTGENNAEEKLEQERIQWTEMESKWISLTDELRADLDTSRLTAEKLRQQLDMEKKCSEELKEALQLAMEGHARMLEQYAELEEKHMQMLARHRKMQEGIEDVKKAAARAGVSRAESKFINALAAQISALKVEGEKERRYLRDENKVLQSQLRDTAEAVQAAGELLVRLKEAEEAVSAALKRASRAEEEAEQVRKQIDKLKKKHDNEVHALDQIIEQSHLPKGGAVFDSHPSSNMPNYDDVLERRSGGDDDDHRWKKEFEALYNDSGDTEITQFDEPSSWFSGYDRCNI